ncbi:hypothetical protein [Persicobacter psychrovividus]|uniref:Uncharacterized protein n=1 Tax=Persicobacter psychrovividus TaxID=387638 RepID=A0ABM7VHK9_9BACT|nr:hypothetical protein PEPS_27060 [Persicobacter psychrovividus]
MPVFDFLNFLQTHALAFIGILSALLIVLIIRLQQMAQQIRQTEEGTKAKVKEKEDRLLSEFLRETDEKRKENNSRWQKKFNQQKMALEEKTALLEKQTAQLIKLKNHISYLEERIQAND